MALLPRFRFAPVMLAIGAAASCGGAQTPPPPTPSAGPTLSYRDLQQDNEPAPSDGKSRLSASQTEKDIGLLTYALERGYGGVNAVPKAAWSAALSSLRKVAGQNATADEFCDAVADALWAVPDALLSAERREATGNRRCGTLAKKERRVPEVGTNYASDEAKPWTAEVVVVGHATFGVLSITRFAPGDDPIWAEFEPLVRRLMQRDGLVIDLRGNTGGDDARGYQLAELLRDGPPIREVRSVHRRTTPEALTLAMTAYAQSARTADGSMAPHDKKRWDAALLERDKAGSSSANPGWEVKPVDRPSATPGPRAFGKPIAILVDAACASGCESSLEVLRAHKQARVFGERTAGQIHFGDVGSMTLPNSSIRIAIPTKYADYGPGKFYERAGFGVDVPTKAGEDAFEVSLAWLMQQTSGAKIMPVSTFEVPEATRTEEAKRLADLGLKVPEGGPILAHPYATPLTRRSFVVPQGWLARNGARRVYAPALLSDLDALELAMRRAYGGLAVAEKNGWNWAEFFERWRTDLRRAADHWLPLKKAFAPITEFQRFQLDNHTTIPLRLPSGGRSQTYELSQEPGGTCTSRRATDGTTASLDNEPSKKVRKTRVFDGARFRDGWFVVAPTPDGEIDAVQCGTDWISVKPVSAGDWNARQKTILSVTGKQQDRPHLTHIEGEIAYLRLPTFTKANSEIIAKEMASWDKKSGRETALIVDLRGNDGGDAAFDTLEGWVDTKELGANRPFTKRAATSCLYPAFRWGYSSYSSTGLQAPLSSGMKGELQWGLDELFKKDDANCPAQFKEDKARSALRKQDGRPHPRKGKPALVVVTDNGCGSDCELMVATLSKFPEAIVVGTNTYGVMEYIQPGFSVLPNTRLPFRIALGTSDLYGDRRAVDGYGLDVDIVLEGAAWTKEGLTTLAKQLTQRK
jgi:C-terminal processing protease CtpA/Prc